jgi:hypothetical protein
MDASTLAAALKLIFLAMQDGSKTDAWMAGQMAAAIQAYILTGQAVTADAGTAPAGAYAGAGTGAMTIDTDALETDLAATFEDTQADSFLALGMAVDIDAACGADDTIETVSSGTVTTPVGVTSSFTGAGTGTFTGELQPLAALLLACFTVMGSMPAGGDEYMAAQVALAVDGYLRTGTIAVVLQAPLLGAGEGGMS